jgi:hypothetical protein
MPYVVQQGIRGYANRRSRLNQTEDQALMADKLCFLFKSTHGIFYEYKDEPVVIYVIFDTSADPKKWQLRLR